jgi:hypothetical protein
MAFSPQGCASDNEIQTLEFHDTRLEIAPVDRDHAAMIDLI